MSEDNKYIAVCNGANVKIHYEDSHHLILEHREHVPGRNTRIQLHDFSTSVYHLTPRLKDLLTIAGYTFAADRKSYRGEPDNVDYESWSRVFQFHINVREPDFWNKPEVKENLSEALRYMTGDHSYEFNFYQAGADEPGDLFDDEEFIMQPENELKVTLFSGGIDSLAGVIETLETTGDDICLVSHQSGQWATKKTQNKLGGELLNLYPNRCKHYKYECGLHKDQSRDESQRTRAFLYTSTAFAIANTYKQNRIFVFENGITSINFPETQDLMNSRSSRTTHPKTLGLLEKLFSKIAEEDFVIEHPFLFKTKTDVVSILKQYDKLNLLDSSVSCGKSRDGKSGFTHCGKCSQCIDRIFATYAAEVERYDDNGIYSFNFLKDPLDDEKAKKSLTDYIRLAQGFADCNTDGFWHEHASEIIELMDFMDGSDEEILDKVYGLSNKHAKQIEYSLERMRDIYDKPLRKRKSNSFFNIIFGPRIYQKDEIEQMEQTTQNEEGKSFDVKNNIKDERQSDYESLNNELGAAHNIIKRQRNKMKLLEQGITKADLLKLIQDNKCLKKNGKINYSSLGKLLGVTNHTAKSKCKFFDIPEKAEYLLK